MFRLLLLIVSLFLLTACSQTEQSHSPSLTGSTTVTTPVELDPDEKIALAKKRKSYINLIRKWDFYALRNAPLEALSAYLEVAEKLPQDQVIQKKIAHIYFLLKNWSKSYSGYAKIPLTELSEDERSELFRSLFFDETLFDRIGELTRYQIGSWSLDYYRIVDTCYGGIHNCILAIQDYSGSSVDVLSLQNQIQTAEKISPSREYRNTMVALKFYEQKMYRATVKILEEVEKEFPDYQETKKILAFSYFALGNYDEAKKRFLQYLDTHPTDLDTITKLGETYALLWDYASSNLYLNNAILSGYTPKTNLERRLAYNYSQLSDTVGMMKVLNYLLQEDDVTEEDYAVAISLARGEWDYVRARAWAEEALTKYPNSAMLTPLFLSVLRLSWDFSGALDVFASLPKEVLEKNTNFLLEEWLLLSDIGKDTEATPLLEKVTETENWPDLVSEAQLALDRIRSRKTPEQNNTGWW